MKIRIKGNSIRLRLTKTDVQNLKEKGIVEEKTIIGSEEIFKYSLIVDEKMVNKTANKVGTMVADLLMDRHQISSSNTTPKVKQKNKIKFNKNIFYILIFSAIAMYLYYNPSQFKLMKETTMAIIKNL